MPSLTEITLITLAITSLIIVSLLYKIRDKLNAIWYRLLAVESIAEVIQDRVRHAPRNSRNAPQNPVPKAE